ncbi:MAG: PCRF domain-containing protein [Candidatus Pacebacteria bacterium]|nr:PCRF domain-containing protein [Candidatus Paceibacterota bacterium]
MNPFQQQLDEIQQKIEEYTRLLQDPELCILAQEELRNLEDQRKTLEDAFRAMQTAKDRNTQNNLSFSNCTIEIRPGTGGDEAKIWCIDLIRMYSRYAATRGWKIEELDEGVVKFIAKDAYETLKYEGGVHRVQRVPATEAQGRIHTSTASVAVLPEIPQAVVDIKEDDLEWQFTRAGGHGGQNVNKVASAVRLTHRPTGIVVESRRERYQARNRELALEILRAKLWEIEEAKREQSLEGSRSVIGRAMRAEKIRTYNYPQNRVTDHRIHKSWYALETNMEGGLQDVFDAMKDEKNWSEPDHLSEDED